MFINGALVEDGRSFRSEVCIVGAGAAGITLALALAERGIGVTLLESGDFDRTNATDALLGVEMSGIPYPIHSTRERYFGGTTNHWGGICIPYDAFEFEAHPWVPYSGWPITREELDPYYEAAREVIGQPSERYEYDPEEKQASALPRLLDASARGIDTVVWRSTKPGPARMGPMYRERISVHPRIRCFLNTTVSQIEVAGTGKRVRGVETRTINGRTLRFHAEDVALCGGAIENARLLLMSDRTVPGGLGNQHDLVGRFFMDHPGRWLGDLVVKEPPGGGLYQEESILRAPGGWGNGADLLGWSTTPALRRAKKLYGFMTFANAIDIDEASDTNAAAVRELARGLRGGKGSDDEAVRILRLAVNWEQTPNPKSRVTLSDTLDPLGLRMPALHWEVAEQDLASANASGQLFAEAVARSGNGRLGLLDLSEGRINVGGGHHMGTTRMADDPKQGVTDREGRVHGIQNLFVGGSSVFPTGGWQHPTLSIVALALRTADTLEQEWRRRRRGIDPRQRQRGLGRGKKASRRAREPGDLE